MRSLLLGITGNVRARDYSTAEKVRPGDVLPGAFARIGHTGCSAHLGVALRLWNRGRQEPGSTGGLLRGTAVPGPDFGENLFRAVDALPGPGDRTMGLGNGFCTAIEQIQYLALVQRGGMRRVPLLQHSNGNVARKPNGCKWRTVNA